MFKILFDSVAEIMEMPDSDKELCYKYFEPIEVQKSTLIETAGKVTQHQYFIASGYLRNFNFDAQGKEITTDMNNGPRFFTSYNSFMNRTISNENIECVTSCALLRITRDNVDILFSKSIILKDYTIMILQKFLTDEQNRARELSTLTAEQRYQNFITNQPNILQHMPLQYIASYLGIQPETLSRIRRKTIS